MSGDVFYTVNFLFEGEFFLAEMIESQDEDHKTIVADVSKFLA